MALNKYVKYGLYSLPLVIGGVAIWYIWKHYKIPKPTPVKTNPDGSIPKKGAAANQIANATSINAQYFPLQSGSNNQYVTELQDELGVTMDGDFGPLTLAALQEQTGKSSISSLSDLITTEASIDAQDQSASNVAYMSSLANNILSNYTSNTWLTVENDTVWNQVQQNNDGSYSSVGNQITFTAGTKINLKDYEPYAIDPNSNNIIIESTGTNSNFFDTILNNNSVQALWSANPGDIILQA